MFNKGFIYRFGIAVKEFGECMGRLPVLRWCCGTVISLGIVIKDSVINSPMEEM